MAKKHGTLGVRVESYIRHFWTLIILLPSILDLLSSNISSFIGGPILVVRLRCGGRTDLVCMEQLRTGELCKTFPWNFCSPVTFAVHCGSSPYVSVFKTA